MLLWNALIGVAGLLAAVDAALNLSPQQLAAARQRNVFEEDQGGNVPTLPASGAGNAAIGRSVSLGGIAVNSVSAMFHTTAASLPPPPVGQIVNSNALNNGFQTFNFFAPGTEADTRFVMLSSSPIYLTVSDFLLPGDSFKVYDNDRLLMETPGVQASLTIFAATLDAALASPLFSHGEIVIRNGLHTIRIFAKDSPFGAGTAGLKAVSVAICPSQPGGRFFLITTPMTWDNVDHACGLFHSRAANITRHNRFQAFQTLLGCGVGPTERAWIGSVRGKKFNGEPLTLQAISQQQGVARKDRNSVRLPILCETKIKK